MWSCLSWTSRIDFFLDILHRHTHTHTQYEDYNLHVFNWAVLGSNELWFRIKCLGTQRNPLFKHFLTNVRGWCSSCCNAVYVYEG
jgi:hypothetical protein